MTSKEFVIWLRGFTEGVHDFNITPKQWDLLKSKLEEVSDQSHIGTAVSRPSGTSTYNPAVTTAPGTTAYITIAGPYITPFSSGSYNPSSITFTTSSGLGVGTSYTTNGAPNWYTTYFADLNDKTND